MSKDSNNENSIEYSTDIINKYSNQSKNMTYKTLVECLDECNKADINYNISSNKKILIELSLYKINQLISSESVNKSVKADKNIVKEESVHEKITEHEITLDTVIDTADKSDSVVQPKSRTLSINALSEKDDNKIQQNSSGSSEVILSQEILLSKWSEFIKKLEEDKDTNLMIALSNFTPKLKDNHNIEVYVSNTSQKEIAISRLNFIKTYLSERLNNDKIQINFEVSELDEKNKKPYTNSEKFKEMVNQNPNLEELRSKFDLDYDY